MRLWETTLQHIPPTALSRVSAYDWFGSLAIQPIGVALVGPIATAIGITTTLYLAAGLEVLALTALVLMHDICIGPRARSSAPWANERAVARWSREARRVADSCPVRPGWRGAPAASRSGRCAQTAEVARGRQHADPRRVSGRAWRPAEGGRTSCLPGSSWVTILWPPGRRLSQAPAPRGPLGGLSASARFGRGSASGCARACSPRCRAR